MGEWYKPVTTSTHASNSLFLLDKTVPGKTAVEAVFQKVPHKLHCVFRFVIDGKAQICRLKENARKRKEKGKAQRRGKHVKTV